MNEDAQARKRRSRAQLRSLLPPGEAPASAQRVVERLGLWDRPQPPRTLLNMVSTVDGRATLGGRSGPLSSRADRELFHALRAAVDGVLVGAGTVRAERYGRTISDEARRELRQSRGLPAEPLACVVSGRLALDADIPLLAEPAARVVVLTSSQASLPASRARVEYVRAERDGRLDLGAAIAEVRERFEVASLLCEGGPHLAGELLAAGLVDELFLSLSPLLAGGEPSAGEALRIIGGVELEPPVELELLGALQDESFLFLRYGVSAAARVSRETTASSSPAR
jgi:riboflavin biosynthesis pyrimidine reductase